MNTYNTITVETIMKKTYIFPQTNIVTVGVQNIIMGSPLDSNDEKPNTAINHEEYNNEFASRRNSVWDDEDEDF